MFGLNSYRAEVQPIKLLREARSGEHAPRLTAMSLSKSKSARWIALQVGGGDGGLLLNRLAWQLPVSWAWCGNVLGSLSRTSRDLPYAWPSFAVSTTVTPRSLTEEW